MLFKEKPESAYTFSASPSQGGEYVKTFRWDHWLQIKEKNLHAPRPYDVSHIQRIGCQPEKYSEYFIYTVANPARGLLVTPAGASLTMYREIRSYANSIWDDNNNNNNKHGKENIHACLGATQASVRLASVQGFLRLIESVSTIIALPHGSDGF